MLTGCFALLLVGLLFSPATSHSLEIAIDISPNVLNLQSQGTVVTVHTDIAYSSVDASSVFLNEIAIDWWKADDCGNFVAKFLMEDVKALENLFIGDYNTFVIEGSTVNGESFEGEQDILIIDVVPRGR